MQLQAWLARAAQQLTAVSDSATFEARLLAQKVTAYSLAQLHWKDIALNDAQQSALQTLLEKRLAGVPMAYLLGSQPFYGLDLAVTEATLIPRPETELLVDTALAHLPKTAAKIADLGTGSGAIALAIASERPDCAITATDKSTAALAIAQKNAQALHLHNIQFLVSDWFSALKEHDFTVIVSNPPYIDSKDTHLPALHYEPQSALVSANQGYADLYHLIANASDYLASGGWLLLEHGFEQGARLRSYAKQFSTWNHIATLPDLAHLERITLMQKR